MVGHNLHQVLISHTLLAELGLISKKAELLIQKAEVAESAEMVRLTTKINCNSAVGSPIQRCMAT